MPFACPEDRSSLPRRGPRARSFPIVRADPRRTVSPSLRPLARQRREGFLPASCARPARLATPRKFRFRNARRSMRAADVCFPLLLFDSVHPCLVGSRPHVGAARAPRSSRNEVLHGTSLASAGRVLLFLLDASWGVLFPARAARPYLWHFRRRIRLAPFRREPLGHDRDRFCPTAT